MAANFSINHKISNGKLLVSPRGDFDGNSAWELFNLINDAYSGQGQIVIETGMLRNICPFGCSTFQCQMSFSRIPRERLFFQGEKGHVIAPEGSNIINVSGHHQEPCSGRCRNCRYRPRKTNRYS